MYVSRSIYLYEPNTSNIEIELIRNGYLVFARQKKCARIPLKVSIGIECQIGSMTAYEEILGFDVLLLLGYLLLYCCATGLTVSISVEVGRVSFAVSRYERHGLVAIGVVHVGLDAIDL